MDDSEVLRIIERGDDRGDIAKFEEALRRHQPTPEHVLTAIRKGKQNFLRILFERGVSTQQDDYWWYAIQRKQTSERIAFIRILLDAHCTPPTYSYFFEFIIFNLGDLDLLCFLAASGVNLSAVKFRSGRTALQVMGDKFSKQTVSEVMEEWRHKVEKERSLRDAMEDDDSLPPPYTDVAGIRHDVMQPINDAPAYTGPGAGKRAGSPPHDAPSGRRRRVEGPTLLDIIVDFVSNPNVTDGSTGNNILHHIASMPASSEAVMAFSKFAEAGVDPTAPNRAGQAAADIAARSWGKQHGKRELEYE